MFDRDRYFRPLVISKIPIKGIVMMFFVLNSMFIIMRKNVIIPNIFIRVSMLVLILVIRTLKRFVLFILVFRYFRLFILVFGMFFV